MNIEEIDKKLMSIYEEKELDLLSQKRNKVYDYILRELNNMKNLINDDDYLENETIITDCSIQNSIRFKEGHFISDNTDIEDIDIEDFLYLDDDLIKAKKRIDEKIKKIKTQYIERIEKLL